MSECRGSSLVLPKAPGFCRLVTTMDILVFFHFICDCNFVVVLVFLCFSCDVICCTVL